ncbi:hypothetical protein NA57DRAFT_52573 [Rhizodiscina lignyota]|uniref:Glycosyltransferase family 34 protein n=1 Tax=Rhizodiscina lignyota TaxID=1504668 RepID=A0A9P4IR84_9PEZI|nr:hypothetical protein NA57DRAFT_52573 [Rhizodiscina lignyota]
MHFYSSSRQAAPYLPRHKMGAKAHVNHPMSTRRRNQYIKWGVIAALLIFLFFNWRSTADEIQAISPYTISITEKGKSPAAAKDGAESADVATDGAANAEPKKEEEKHDNQMKIAIVTFTTSEKSYTYMSLKNKHAYARRHNYTLLIDYDAPESHDVGIMWHKFKMMEDLVHAGTHDWIWWIDFDTLITNLNIKLDDIIKESLYNVSSVFPAAKNPDFKTQFNSAEADGVDPSNIDFLLTADCFPLNAGSMLVRGRLPPSRQTPLTTVDFLDRVRKYHAANASYENQLSEQDCMRDMLFDMDPGYTEKHVRMIPQWKTNAFPEEIKCWDKDDRGWEKGTFAIHFAGAWAHLKDDDPTGVLMRKYEPEIVD